MQARQAEKDAAGGSAGDKRGFWGIFKGTEDQGLREEYEKLQKMYQVAQEDLQVKIEEIELEH